MDGIARVWALGVLLGPGDAGVRITLGIPRRCCWPRLTAALQALAMLIGVSLLAFAGAWLFAEYGIRRHVARIASVAARVGAGDLGARIGAPYPRGELGELMAVFDRTTGAVQANRRKSSRGAAICSAPTARCAC